MLKILVLPVSAQSEMCQHIILNVNLQGIQLKRISEAHKYDKASAVPKLGSESVHPNFLCRNTGVVEALITQAEARGNSPSLKDLLIEESWKQHLQSEFSKPYMSKLEQFLHEEWKANSIFPPKHLIFR